MSSAGQPIVGPVPEGRDPDDYDRLRRRVLWSLPTGLYVVGTPAGDRRNLMTISWVIQVAMNPKLVGISVETTARTHELLTDGGVFALSILPRAERTVVRRYAKPVTQVSIDDPSGGGTMQGMGVHRASTGAPVLDVALAWLDCEVRHVLALGSHSLFVGEVVDCAVAVPAGGDSGTPAEEPGSVLRMEDTRMNYGG